MDAYPMPRVQGRHYRSPGSLIGFAVSVGIQCSLCLFCQVCPEKHYHSVPIFSSSGLSHWSVLSLSPSRNSWWISVLSFHPDIMQFFKFHVIHFSVRYCGTTFMPLSQHVDMENSLSLTSVVHVDLVLHLAHFPNNFVRPLVLG